MSHQLARPTIAREFGLTQTAAPGSEPVTLAEAKLWLRETQDDQDDVIDHLITYAREKVEGDTSRQLITATFKLFLDQFVDLLYFPVDPVQSITSIAYVDIDGDSQTLDASVYQLDIAHDPARLVLAPDQSWPSIQSRLNAVTITFLAGFGGEPAKVPARYKNVMRRIIVDRFDLSRGESLTGLSLAPLPNTIRDELRSLKIPRL